MRKTSLYLLLKRRNLSRQSRSARRNRSLGWAARALTSALALLLIAILLLAGYAYARVAQDLPSIETLPTLLNREEGELLQPTRLYDRSGVVTLFTYQEEGIERKFLSINPDEKVFISPQLVRSVIAAYDPTFWSNPGYSLTHWSSLKPETIAERLVSDLILWNEPESTTRAIRMRILAGQVVSKYGRSRVIEWYLNSAWFGRYAYGVESAARLYLGKSAQQVTLAESALLISLLESPALNPIDAPETSLVMQQELLRRMRASNAINPEEYELARNEEIQLRALDANSAVSAGTFVKQVEKQLKSLIPEQRLRRGGLVVITTLDADLQEQLACTANTQLNRIAYSNVSGVAPEQADCEAALLLPTQSFTKPGNAELAVAGLVMNPRSGEILAYLEPLTLAGQRQVDSGYQPGSLLTPFLAVGAFSRGYSPAHLLWDIPPLENTTLTSNATPTTTYHGAVNIRSALANDYLTPFTTLVNEIGSANAWRAAAVTGLNSLDPPPNDASPLYGTTEASLLELGAAYSTLANAGVRSGSLDSITGEINPLSVLKVTTSGGRALWQAPAADNKVIISDSVTYLINHVLSDESARWPSLGYPNELEIGAEVAAKTGQADHGRQVWTVGYNPQRLALVWVGTRSEDVPAPLDARMAAGIWHAIFKYASRGTEPGGWQRPAGVTQLQVCSPSGMLPTTDCPNLVYDLFLNGNEPTLPDTLFTRVKVNRETGQMATVFTPPALVEEKVFMNVPPEARAWAQSAGIELIPLGYDSIQAVSQDSQANITIPAMFSAVSGVVAIRGAATGEKFASFYVQVGEGINPENWLRVNESARKVEDGGLLAEWDTSGLNGLYAIRLTVVDSASMVKSAVTQVTVDNIPPSARITYPDEGQTVEPVRGGVTITASVEDLVGIDRVEWWVDGRKALEQTTPPYIYQLTGTAAKHTVYLKAWDSAGNAFQSDEVSFQIQP